jgi:hypothetical protein
MFPTIGFHARKILRIIEFQIETERIFSLTKILINLRICHLQLEHLDNLIFVSKKWPNDLRVGCKSPSNLVAFIESDLNLEKKFEEFERAFERDEVVEL